VLQLADALAQVFAVEQGLVFQAVPYGTSSGLLVLGARRSRVKQASVLDGRLDFQVRDTPGGPPGLPSWHACQ
jgi:hypothetical protein